MNIGITPQQQLAVIRYVHRRANIIGLILGGLGVLTMVPSFIIYGISSGTPAMVLGGFGFGIVLVLGGLLYMRCYVWSYYWLAEKLGKEMLFALAVTLNPVREKEVNELRRIGNGNFELKTRTEMTIFMPALIIAFIGIAILFWVGLYFAIKYTRIGSRLKKQT